MGSCVFLVKTYNVWNEESLKTELKSVNAGHQSTDGMDQSTDEPPRATASFRDNDSRLIDQGGKLDSRPITRGPVDRCQDQTTDGGGFRAWNPIVATACFRDPDGRPMDQDKKSSVDRFAWESVDRL